MKATTPILGSILLGNRYALALAGSSQYGAAPDAATLRITGDMTISGWVYVNNFTAASGILSKTVGAVAAPYDFQLNATTGKPELLRGNGTASAGVVATAAPVLGAWQHIAVVMQGTTVTHYLNGAANGTGTLSTAISDGGHALRLGTREDSGTALNGAIDELRLYSRALTAAEIAEHVTGQFHNESGLVGYWGMDDGSGTTATDLSLYSNHFTLTGTPGFAADNPYPGSERQLFVADLLTIVLQDGISTYRYSGSDKDLVYGGNTYTAADTLFTRGKTRIVLGSQVDNMDLTLYGTSTNLIGGASVLSACALGILDGAHVQVDKAIMIDPRYAVVGISSLFNGLVGKVDVSRQQAKITVNSDLQLLNIQLPRNLVSPPCIHVLYDDDMLKVGLPATGCTLNKATYAVTGTVAAGSNQTAILATLSQATGYFDLGLLEFTSGVNNGKIISVKSYTSGGTINLAYPLQTAPSAGDTFVVYPGCDHTQNTCQTKFNNLAHFRGFPYVPVQEAVLGY